MFAPAIMLECACGRRPHPLYSGPAVFSGAFLLGMPRNARATAGSATPGYGLTSTMPGPRIEPVKCPECGLRAAVFLRQSGPENVLKETAPNCRFKLTGFDVFRCPSLKATISEAHQRLQKL
jgi:hypothetical protein